jgi:hypothetical protein
LDRIALVNWTSVLAWCNAEGALKYAIEVALVVKAVFGCDFSKGFGGS